MARKICVVVAVVIFLMLGFRLTPLYARFTVTTPQYPTANTRVWLPQGWTAKQRDWFHHADQGTQTVAIPYEWFTALEQPQLSFSNSDLLSDPEYLDRFGFISEEAGSATYNPDQRKNELPVGFAHGGQALDVSGAPFRNPRTGAQMTSLGLTCAACHTGRFTYEKSAFFIDGAPALTNVKNFQKAVGLSIIYTRLLPTRFARFSERVLGQDASAEAKSGLRAQFEVIYKQVWELVKLEKLVEGHTVDEGFARLDALSRIGNTVFALDLNQHENFVAYSAPVHFPRIWNASWFAWVQYNGSIEQPMTRNAGEALGVGATLKFPAEKGLPLASNVRIDNIFNLEQLLAGDPPPTSESGFRGLNSPEWPEQILPPINRTLTATGANLYQTHCQKCHLPARSDPEFWTAPQWTKTNPAGERYLDLKMIDISRIGTDSAQAEDMKNREVAVPLTVGVVDGSGRVVTVCDFGDALGQVVTKVVNHWYDSQLPPTPPEMREKMNGFRPDGIRARLQYKARPLNGIWAAPPYLHNGSVPNLYFVLSPVAERPKTFYLGNREYDPVNVGYRTDELAGGFKFDTSIRGNSNTGHEFNNGSGKGIIGPLLSPEERRALIEYLKTL